MPAVGEPAPAFRLPDQDGNPVALADLAGQWVVLWWYPKAATSG
jgi:peroxiredoxin Q/BCP